jgi:predicted outer membrane repeat protein
MGGYPDGPRVLVLEDVQILTTDYSWALVAFDDITIIDSTIDAANTAVYSYGSVVIDNSSITAASYGLQLTSNATVSGNAVVRDSSITGSVAIRMDGAESLTVEDSTVTGTGYFSLQSTGGTANFVRTSVSGQMSVTGSASAATLQLQESTVTDATTFINAIGDVTLNVEDSTFDGATNVAIRVESTASGTSTFARNTFSNNYTGSGFRGYGGALYLEGHTFVVQDNVFDGNTTEKDGGAVYVREADATFSGNTFTNNVGFYGGAIAVGYLGTMTSSGDTFDGNEAQAGSAIRYDASLPLEDATVINNRGLSSYAGGAIYSYALELSGTWDFGSGSTDNTEFDFYDSNDGETYTITTGSGSLTYGGASESATPE